MTSEDKKKTEREEKSGTVAHMKPTTRKRPSRSSRRPKRLPPKIMTGICAPAPNLKIIRNERQEIARIL